MSHLLEKTGKGRHPRSPYGDEVDVERLFGHECSIKTKADYSIGGRAYRSEIATGC